MHFRARSLFAAILVLVLVLVLGTSQQPIRAEAELARFETIRLENGLQLFVVPRRSSPTFAAVIMSRAGSATDPRGQTGLAHLVEHLMFRGSETLGTLDHRAEVPLLERLDRLWTDLYRELDLEAYPFGAARADEERGEELRREIAAATAALDRVTVEDEFLELATRAGGVGINASTGYDATGYLGRFPAHRLEFWMRLESERFLRPVFRDFYAERDTVLDERRQQIDGNPAWLAREILKSTIYGIHPYGSSVIGWPRDLERLTHADAEAYFRDYYTPGNSFVVLVGDLDARQVERLARKYFGPWPRREAPRPRITAELELRGERRRVLELAAAPVLQMAWMTVPEGHRDQPALDVLAGLLADLESSRLNAAVVRGKGLAASVSGRHATERFGGHFGIDAYPADGVAVAELEAAIEGEIARLRQQPPDAAELARAKLQIEADRLRRLDSNLDIAWELGRDIVKVDDPAYFFSHGARIDQVTAEQIQAVVRKYLEPQRKSVVEVRSGPGARSGPNGAGGWYDHHREVSELRRHGHSPGFEAMRRRLVSGSEAALPVPDPGRDVERVDLGCGPVALLAEDRELPLVRVAFTWAAGTDDLPAEDAAAARLAGDLIAEGGSETLDPDAVARRLEDLGSSFSITVDDTSSRARLWSPKSQLGDSLDLALDLLTRPRLDPARLAALRQRHLGQLSRRSSDLLAGAREIVHRVLDGDAVSRRSAPSAAELEGVGTEAVRSVWRRLLGPGGLHLTVAGDFEREPTLALLERRLCSWRPAERSADGAGRDIRPRELVARPGAFVVGRSLPAAGVVVTELLDVDRTAPIEDHAALEIVDALLGGSGLRSRLMLRLRTRERLTYSIRSSLSHETEAGIPGKLEIVYRTAGFQVARSVASVLEEVRRLVDEPPAAEEVEEQVEAWENALAFRSAERSDDLAGLVELALERRPRDHDRRLAAAVRRLRPADVQRVARRYLDPDRLTVAVFGDVSRTDLAVLEQTLGLEELEDPTPPWRGFGN